MERIPDDIMNEARAVSGAYFGDGYVPKERFDNLSSLIARALVARDQRAAEIARTYDNRTGQSIADAILSEAGEEER